MRGRDRRFPARCRLMMRPCLLSLVLFVTLVGAPGSAAAQTGTLTGRVIAGKEPALGADVHVLGTNLGAGVADDGAFRITGVPVGSRTIRIRYRGWLSKDVTLAVDAGAN